MSRFLRATVVAGAVLIASAVGWRTWAVRLPPSPPAPQASHDGASVPQTAVPQVSVGLQGASIVLRHRGVRQAEIRAGSVTVSSDLRTARFVGITRALVYDQAGEPLQVTAGGIVLDRETSNFQIQGPVTITSPRGYRLTASAAEWHHARQQVVFPRGVHVSYRGQELQAGRLVVDAGLTTFDLSGGVDIVFRIEGMRP